MGVAIIGAGLGGIATAVKLRQQGITDFTVFEQSHGPGGTWWDNHYPGCEVDVPSQLYSFSFMPYDWSRSYATHAELRRYVADTIDHFGIRDHFRFDCGVESVEWNGAGYTLALAGGERHHCGTVVSCVGFLNQPRYPEWPGVESFAGPKFHTSRYEHEHDLSDQRVAIVGTGSTAIQLTARLADVARHVYVYQREPGWIFPKRSKNYRPRTRRIRALVPGLQSVERAAWWATFDVGLRWVFTAGSGPNRLTEKLCRTFIGRRIKDPVLRAQVTPAYPLGCKRIMFDDTFYSALTRDNVTLVPSPVRSVTADGLVAEDGVHRPADALIMATGFKAQDYLASIRVRGPGGRDLHETWKGEPKGFLGITMPGFPNFFMVYGPNTNGGNSIIFQLERQAEVAARMIRRMRRAGATTIDTRPGMFERYDGWIAGQVRTRLTTGTACHNYYYSPTGRNVTQWPRGGADYWALTKVLPSLAMRTGKS